MTRDEPHVGIIGGGITGLSSAYLLAKKGLKVTVLEQANKLGGLASTFDFHGQPLEFFYHHIFRSDKEIISLIQELNLNNNLIFSRPSNAIYYDGTTYPFNGAVDLLKFPPLSLSERLITGLNLFYLQKSNWRSLEGKTADEWLSHYLGQQSYQTLWQPLLQGKFGPKADQIALTWFWARLTSRTPQLGYLQGGFQTLINKLENEIIRLGGIIKTGYRVEHLAYNSGEFTLNYGSHHFTHILSTITPSALEQISTGIFSYQYANQFLSQPHHGVVCLVLSLKKRLTNYYWTNINDPQFPFIGVIEHTNYQSPSIYNNRHLVYLVRYLPTTDKVYTMSKKELLADWLPYLKRLNRKFTPQWLDDSYLFRAPYAQPIVATDYHRSIPDIKTPVKGIYLASMAQIYPFDRGMNYAVQIANRAASTIFKEIS